MASIGRMPLANDGRSIPFPSPQSALPAGSAQGQPPPGFASQGLLPARLRRPTEPNNTLRPRTARAELQWPDGRTSSGSVTHADARTMFRLDANSTVLGERLDKPGKRTLAPHRPRPLEVETVARNGSLSICKPQLSALEGIDRPVLYTDIDSGTEKYYLGKASLGTEDWRQLIFAGARNDREAGIWPYQERLMNLLLARQMHAIASECTDPQAVRSAARTLSKSAGHMHIFFGQDGSQRVSTNLTGAPSDAQLDRMAVGDHLLVRVHQLEEAHHWAGHVMALSITCLSKDDFRVTIVNSNGWTEGQLAMGKTMNRDALVEAMGQFSHGNMPTAGTFSPEDWANSGYGLPLREWLNQAGSQGAEGPPPLEARVKSTPQKGNDCSMEHKFAWLASVLAPADYKFVKASFLNGLKLQAEKMVASESSAEKYQSLQEAVELLNARITSSLSGSVVAPGAY